MATVTPARPAAPAKSEAFVERQLARARQRIRALDLTAALLGLAVLTLVYGVGMILLDGCLYGANGGNEGGFLVCLDFKTGRVLWDERDSGKRRAPKGSVALADGRLYYRTENGTMLLIEPNPKQYVERGRFEQPDRSEKPAWAHPVIANGKLYLRDQDVLLCYGVKAADK